MTAATTANKDVFGAEPFGKSSAFADPFGMDDFGRVVVSSPQTETSLTYMEMREGFSRGISFGEDDFNLESLDPLRS